LYPPIARAAHVSGDVVIQFHVLEDGSTADFVVVSGPEMLRGAAIDGVRTWRYAKGQPSLQRAIVKFSFDENEYQDELLPKPAISFDSDGNQTIKVNAPTLKSRSKCPDLHTSHAPGSTSANDYVELFRSGCFGPCPVYDVRIQRDGTVHWKGNGFVAVEGEATSRIPMEQATALLDAFQSHDFWDACGDYSASITDNPTYVLKADIAGLHKEISDYADAAPKAIQSLEMLVDEVADSHLWRVGDPNREHIEDIREDAYLPKPGRTELMRLAAYGKEEELKAALASGAKLTDVDASGWNALMYSASTYGCENVKLLLDKGADPNVQGPNGETALMFAALNGHADEDLLAAKSDVNAKTHDGVTTLMLLVQRPDIDEINKLLDAGADARAKDKEGRTALDYLEAANCGRAILSEPSFMTFGGGTSCHMIDKEPYQAARLRLEKAGAKQTRAWYPAP
jgi:hypothetical protein